VRRLLYNTFKAAVVAVGLVFLAGCNYNSQAIGSTVPLGPIQQSAWIAYWDLEAGEKDIAKLGKKLEKLSYFGAYFDKDDRLFLPKELSDKRTEHQKQKVSYKTYLTFVNDKQNADGSTVMKDTEVLRRLFTDDASMDKHIADIIALTKQGGYDGIEIDYERIWKDEKVGQVFVRFTDKLYEQAVKNDLYLRVVLEPSSPFTTIDFPRGPEYVVMLYNLHGPHNSPGPKANKEFIQKKVKQMAALPGEKSVAFSTGGCLWGDNGEKRFLTEVEAKTLAVTHGAKLNRDDGSQCLIFTYKEKGVSYQVWYADVKTLQYWIATAQELGQSNISLWRLGGNIDINKIN